MWTAVNNRDNIAYPDDGDYDGDGRPDQGDVLPSYVNDHPLEPLARLTPGRDLGWPYCNPDPDLDPGVPGSPLSYTKRPFVRDVQTNADGTKLDCGTLAPVEQGLGAHSAPLGLSFATSPGCRRRGGRARWSACTGRGTASRPGRRRSRSSRGATARSTRNRPCSAASRPRTARGGAGR